MLAKRLSIGIGFVSRPPSCRAVHGRRRAGTRRMCTARARSSWRSKETSWKSNSNRRRTISSASRACRRQPSNVPRWKAPWAALKKGEALFRLTPAAGCKLRETEVETPLAESDHKDEHKGEHKARGGRGAFGVSRPLPFPLRAARAPEGRGGSPVRRISYDAEIEVRRYPAGRPARGDPEAGCETLRFLTPCRDPSRLLIRLADIRFRWRSRDPLVLDIPELVVVDSGERLFVRGPSGGGKTTLLNLLGGVIEPEAGTVSILGTEMAGLRGGARDAFRAGHIGFVFQMFNLVPYLPLIDNVLLPCRFSARRQERAGARPRGRGPPPADAYGAPCRTSGRPAGLGA